MQLTLNQIVKYIEIYTANKLEDACLFLIHNKYALFLFAIPNQVSPVRGNSKEYGLCVPSPFLNGLCVPNFLFLSSIYIKNIQKIK